MSTTSAHRPTELSVLDLTPIPNGGRPRDAIIAAIELAQTVEEHGYRGYWFGEHHLGPGRAGSSPIVLSALVAQETERIQVGTAVAVLPNSSPLAFVEQFGTIAQLHPGRVQIGIGRASKYQEDPITPGVEAVLRRLRTHPGDPRGAVPSLDVREYPALNRALLRVDPFDDGDFDESVYEVLALLRENVAEIDGELLHAAPGYQIDAVPWLFGWTAGPSARLAGTLGLPYVANAHNNAFPIAENVAHYREHFRPSSFLLEPHVAVSTQVLVAETIEDARKLAAPYTKWIHLLRRRGWATTAEVIEEPFTPDDPEERAALDRALGLRYVGTPGVVAAQLDELATLAGADELIVHTFTADTASRRRSYELLGRAWAERTSVGDDIALATVSARH